MAKSPPKPRRPQVQVTRDLHKMTTITEIILKRINATDPQMFQFGESLVRVRTGVEPRFERVTRDAMTRYLAEIIEFYRPVNKGEGRTIEYPPPQVVRSILASESPPLPHVERLVTIPVYTREGTLVATPGYSSEGKLFLVPGIEVPTISLSPSRQDLNKAVALLSEEVLCDFPFVTAAGMANTITALLVQPVRSMIEGPTPFHLIDAPAKGTGKSLLAGVIRGVVAPRAGVITGSRDKSEWQKTITALVISGTSVIVIDNLHGHLDSDALAAVLTETIWSDRLLGVSKTVVVPNTALWMGTANGLTLSDELQRRTVPIRLDAQVEEPHRRPSRDFKHPDLLTWVKEHRPELVWASLTIVQAWIDAGQPKRSASMASFVSWSEVMGGILDVAGIEGFLSDQGEWADSGADPITTGWQAFVAEWAADLGTSEVKVSALVSVYDRVESDFLILGEGDERSRVTRLGKALAQKRNAVVGNYTLMVRSVSKSNRWRLQPK